jgi:hypothetical protein
VKTIFNPIHNQKLNPPQKLNPKNHFPNHIIPLQVKYLQGFFFMLFLPYLCTANLQEHLPVHALFLIIYIAGKEEWRRGRGRKKRERMEGMQIIN